MPFIQRDPATGAIAKALNRQFPDSEYLAHGHPDLTAFLSSHGIDPQEVGAALEQLRATDMDMARAVEDVITALLKKNLLKMSDLPKAVQDRIALRVKLRVQIAEVYDRASAGRTGAT